MVGVQRTSNRSLERLPLFPTKSMLLLPSVRIPCTVFPLVSGTKLVRADARLALNSLHGVWKSGATVGPGAAGKALGESLAL
jgi:hypothetical protein